MYFETFGYIYCTRIKDYDVRFIHFIVPFKCFISLRLHFLVLYEYVYLHAEFSTENKLRIYTISESMRKTETIATIYCTFIPLQIC